MSFNSTQVKNVLWRNLLERLAAAEDQYDVMEQPLNKALRHIRLNVFPEQLKTLPNKFSVEAWKPVAAYIMNPNNPAKALVQPIADEAKNTQIYGRVMSRAINDVQKKQIMERLAKPGEELGQQYMQYIQKLPFSISNQYEKVADAGLNYMMKDEATYRDIFSKISIMPGRPRVTEQEMSVIANYKDLKQALGKNASNFFVAFNTLLSKNALILGVAEVFTQKYAAQQPMSKEMPEPVGVQASTYAKYASTSFKSNHIAAMMTYSVINRYLDKI